MNIPQDYTFLRKIERRCNLEELKLNKNKTFVFVKFFVVQGLVIRAWKH